MSDENLSERLSAVEQTQKNIQATQAILSELALHTATRIRDHEEWLKRHQLAMEEFDGKLNALIDIISRNQGGIEAKPE